MLMGKGRKGGGKSQEVRARAFLTTQQLPGAKHSASPDTGQAQDRGHLWDSYSETRAGGNPGYSLGNCHFRGGGKLILGMKPSLESRE